MRRAFANGSGRRRRAAPGKVPWRHAVWWGLTTLVLTSVVLAYNLQPGRVTLTIGDTALRTIRSPVTARYLSRSETARARREAEQRVEPEYVFNPYARTEAANTLDLGFDLLLEYRQQPTAARKARLRQQFPTLTPQALAWAEAASPVSLRAVREAGGPIVAQVMTGDIGDDPQNLSRARARAATRVEALPFSHAARQALAAITREALIPNSTYDAAATGKAREGARRSVKPRERVVIVGDPIIYAGERVSSEHLDMLEAAGLINPRVDLGKIGATFALCGLLMLLLAVYVGHYLPQVYSSRRQLLLISMIMVLALATVYLVNLRGIRAEQLGMLTIAGGAMAIGLLLDVQLGVVVAVIESMLLGTMATNQLSISALGLGSSLAGLCLVPRVWPATQSVRAAVLLGGANIILVGGLGWLGGQDVAGLGTQMALGALYGLGAVVAAVGLVFVLQRPFDIVTSIRLLELADPNHPLLKRMMVEAPGSYADSLMVANLAEGAAEVAEANTLLARVGGYYHDVGKLRRPYFFYENQALLGTDNVHDAISPSLSSLVITSHVREGVELAREAGLPVVVQDIIAQHHGTTLVRFFYHRARSSQGGEVPEDMFRYPGPRPQTKEAALVMLADSVFAAVWSLPDKNPHRVEEVVREVISDRLSDGQLSESPLTLKDLDLASERFLRILKNILFHTRIEYPDLEELQRPANGRNGRADQKPNGAKRGSAAAQGRGQGSPPP